MITTKSILKKILRPVFFRIHTRNRGKYIRKHLGLLIAVTIAGEDILVILKDVNGDLS